MIRIVGLAALLCFLPLASAIAQEPLPRATDIALDKQDTNNSNIVLASKNNERNILPDSIESSKDTQQKGLLRIYRSNLLKKTYQHIVYPESAIDKNQEGDVILRITIDRSGKVLEIKYDLRARFNSLNKAAKSALNNAQPFPKVPQRVKGESFELLMPIRFRLTG